jgi:competence CoiA-like predicted nuclease
LLTAYNKELDKVFVGMELPENPEQYTWLCKFCGAEMLIKNLEDKTKYFVPKSGHNSDCPCLEKLKYDR